MTEQIKVQQALFGYRDGHNLLATSTTLSPRVRQFLATITDSSGSESGNGFDAAFTGLPVPETRFYALFCTWLAPEMPRPGCVWSHVILVQLADLARIRELSRLRNLCVRPSLPVDTARFEQEVVFDISRTAEHVDGVLNENRLRYLLRALYEHPDKDVVILDDKCAPWENVVFSIWTQQWPRLRREFSFSTGSLGDRRLAGVPFDLQVAPVNSERLWRRSAVPTLLLNFQAVGSPFGASVPQWVNVAENDLQRESDRRFRQFLFNYGSDIERPRAAFARLAAVYTWLRTDSESSWQDLLYRVAEFFPAQSEALSLKRWLVTVPTSLNPNDKLERAWGIASFLLESDHGAAYPSSDFNFATLAIEFWQGKRQQAIALLSRLVQREEKAAAISFAEGIANAIDTVSFKVIAESHRDLVPPIIRHNPSIAFEVETWKLNGHVQSQIYETLTKLSLSQLEWGRIVGAMFIASTYVSVRDAVELAGEFAMVGAFRWLEQEIAEEVLPSHAWRDALAFPATALLAQTKNLQPAQLALTAWCAPTGEVRRALYASRDDVQRLSEQSLNAIPAPLRIPTAFLLLTIGLRDNSDAAAKLTLKNFFVVHQALASGQHSSESWWLLSPELPTLGWLRDWDRCKRLRRAVSRFLVSNGINQRLFEFANTPDELRLARKVTGIEVDESSEFID